MDYGAIKCKFASMLYHRDLLVILLVLISSVGTFSASVTNNGTIANCAGLKCRRVAETFNKPSLPHGYLEITTIPANAVNISVKQLGQSENRLVLQDSNHEFILNGNQNFSRNGVYLHEGVNYEYIRTEPNLFELNSKVIEEIYASGPIPTPILLMVLVKDRNPGIFWEYFIPEKEHSSTPEPDYYENYENIDWNEPNTPQDFVKAVRSNEIQEVNYIPTVTKRRRKFMWKVIGFSPCSRTCGGGIQTPEFRCVRDLSTRFYSPRRCMHMEKPVFNENIYKCNMQACPAHWHADMWVECKCIHAEEYQKREVQCVQEVSGELVEVESAKCQDEKPQDLRKCDCWVPKKRVSRINQHNRQHIPHRANLVAIPNQRKTFNNNSAGIWLSSDWYTNCSSTCGSGYEYRSIFCDRTFPRSDRCSLKLTPDTVRSCVGQSACSQGEWATTDWSSCSGDCFNLQKKRRVFCVKNKSIVDDADCDAELQPSAILRCDHKDVDYCRPRWFYSDWTPCTKTCGGGTQRRSVRCLEFDREENVLQESENCLYVERQPIYSSCNTHKCPEMLMDSRMDLMQNRIVTCSDLFKNCVSVNKPRYCKLAYYQRHCCYSCREYL